MWPPGLQSRVDAGGGECPVHLTHDNYIHLIYIFKYHHFYTIPCPSQPSPPPSSSSSMRSILPSLTVSLPASAVPIMVNAPNVPITIISPYPANPSKDACPVDPPAKPAPTSLQPVTSVHSATMARPMGARDVDSIAMNVITTIHQHVWVVRLATTWSLPLACARPVQPTRMHRHADRISYWPVLPATTQREARNVYRAPSTVSPAPLPPSALSARLATMGVLASPVIVPVKAVSMPIPA